MTSVQWVNFVGILAATVTIGVVVGALWSRSIGSARRANLLFGCAFALMAVISTAQLVAVGINVQRSNARTELRFAERMDCTRRIGAAIEAREAIRDTTVDPAARDRLLATVPMPQC